MQYMVWLRKYPGGLYEAVAPVVPGLKGEGKTRGEALGRLKTVLEDWLVEAEVTTIEVEIPEKGDNRKLNPWLTTAGIFKDDPLLEPMMHEIYAAREAESPGE